MLNKTGAILLSLFISQTAFSKDIVGAVDLDKVDWSVLCERVGAIVFEQNDEQCEVSHPASIFHNKEIHRIFKQRAPSINLCETLSGEYNYLITPQDGDRNQWALCRTIFKSSLSSRLLTPEHYVHSTSEWMKAYFNNQTMRK